MPLRPMNLDDLRWYFHARQASSQSSEERFDQAARAFRAPRFRALYRAWLERGEPVLAATLSAVPADKIERQVGQLACHVLAHYYLDLSPWVNGPIRPQGDKGGDKPSGRARPLSRLAAHLRPSPSDTRRATVLNAGTACDRKGLPRSTHACAPHGGRRLVPPNVGVVYAVGA
jgi:hypothetical protein